MATFKRGNRSKCGSGCSAPALVSVMMVVQTPGGRKERKMSNTGMYRLCAKCAGDLKKGKYPKPLQQSLNNALWECGVEDGK